MDLLLPPGIVKKVGDRDRELKDEESNKRKNQNHWLGQKVRKGKSNGSNICLEVPWIEERYSIHILNWIHQVYRENEKGSTKLSMVREREKIRRISNEKNSEWGQQTFIPLPSFLFVNVSSVHHCFEQLKGRKRKKKRVRKEKTVPDDRTDEQFSSSSFFSIFCFVWFFFSFRIKK